MQFQFLASSSWSILNHLPALVWALEGSLPPLDRVLDDNLSVLHSLTWVLVAHLPTLHTLDRVLDAGLSVLHHRDRLPVVGLACSLVLESLLILSFTLTCPEGKACYRAQGVLVLTCCNCDRDDIGIKDEPPDYSP